MCRRVGGARDDDNSWVPHEYLMNKIPLTVKTDETLDYSSVGEQMGLVRKTAMLIWEAGREKQGLKLLLLGEIFKN
jgi:hypothetical protein